MLIGQSKGQCKEEAEDNEEDLDDVGVGNGDETPEEGVSKGYDGRADNWDHLVQIENHLLKQNANFENHTLHCTLYRWQ